LTVGRFFGIRADSFVDGAGLAALGLIGALGIGAAFLTPVTLERWSRGVRFAWDLWSLEGAPFVALSLPAALVAVGLVAALPRMPARFRATLLFGGGLAGLWSLGALGPFAACARVLLHPMTCGPLVVAAGALLRLYEPSSRPARVLIGAGLLLTLLGYLWPAEVSPLVPQEMLPYARYHDVSRSGPPLFFFARMLGARGGPTLLHAIVFLVPLVTSLATAVLAWPHPRGTWDLAGPRVRALAWILVLAVPLGYAVGVFLLFGWHSRLAEMALTGRLRMLALSVPICLWVTFGAARLTWRSPRLAFGEFDPQPREISGAPGA